MDIIHISSSVLFFSHCMIKKILFFSKAKISYFKNFLIVNKNICRLDISMDQTSLMDVFKSIQ